MSCSFDLVQGDVNDVRTVTLSGVQDLTTVSSLEGHVWSSTVAVTTIAVTVLSASGRTINVTFGGASGWLSTAAAGWYLVEYQLTFADGTVLTWPEKTPDQAHVRAQGA